MKYTDVFKKPLSRQDVTMATRLAVREKNANTSLLVRRLKWGYGKALATAMLLDDAGVTSPMMRGKRHIILKDESAAVNAALRQLKKGRK